MKEITELRINNKFINLLPTNINGKDLGPVTIIKIEKDSSEYQSISEINKKVKDNASESFFYGWGIKRYYSKEELANATLLHIFFDIIFEPTGEQCGTFYDETTECEICGSHRKQIGKLKLKKGKIPKKDIAQTIGGEVVVSEKFVNCISQRNLQGFQFNLTNIEKYYQLNTNIEIELSHLTLAGIKPFDLSGNCDGEVYKCPKGHTIGLNLISEVFVKNNDLISENDFFKSKQLIGVKRGMLRPQPVYLCSKEFRNMVKEEKLTGFSFEVAHIV